MSKHIKREDQIRWLENKVIKQLADGRSKDAKKHGKKKPANGRPQLTN